MTLYRRYPYNGTRVGLVIDEGNGAWVTAGDLFDVVPRHSWSWLMAKVKPRVINQRIHLPLEAVRKWPVDLRKRDHKDIARGLEKFIQWADEQLDDMKAGATV